MLRAFAFLCVAVALLCSSQAQPARAHHAHQSVVQEIQVGAVVGVEGQASH